MTIFHSIILGLVQGASEFLPISSSAHLVLAPWLFGFSDPGLAFDVALHFGTLAAVVLFFWKDWVMIFRLALFPKVQPSAICGRLNLRQNTFWLLVLATIPGVLAGYFLESYAETTFRSPILIVITLSFVGLILYLVDKYHKHRKKISEITWLDSAIVGLSQAIAIVPGVSRSGATITAGLWQGLGRESAARFSFLLSTPIIFGAAVKQLPDFLAHGIDISVAIGMLSSAISGYLAIKYLLKFVDRASYAIFFWYRLALAVIILSIYFFG